MDPSYRTTKLHTRSAIGKTAASKQTISLQRRSPKLHTPMPDITFHVSPSCLTDSSDITMPKKNEFNDLATLPSQRNDSCETVIHHDRPLPSPHDNFELQARVESEDDEESHKLQTKDREMEIDHDHDHDHLEYQDHEDHEDHESDGESRFTYGTSSDMTYGTGSDLSTSTNDSQDTHDEHLEGSSHLSSIVSHDSHTEALIQAAARAVIASMEEEREDYNHSDQSENDNGNEEHEDSVLSVRTEDHDGDDEETEVNYDKAYGTEISHVDQTSGELFEKNEEHYDGSASSHQDDEDDVFSDGPKSHRSSLNSLSDLHTGDEGHLSGEEHQSGSEAELDEQKEKSRRESGISNAFSEIPEPLEMNPLRYDNTPRNNTPRSKGARPPFRTPSSVRAIQMSSPTPSIFSGSPRSSKRHVVLSGSKSGSPHQTRTPTRFKAPEEPPLVLLHVTALPLHWTYAPLLQCSGSGEGWSKELCNTQDSWRLLQQKLTPTVLERGILLSHPQDDFEVLEERLLEALELPVRPRAKILACGHYLGPESDMESDSDDSGYASKGGRDSRPKWCDICGEEKMFENFGEGVKQKRFRVKIYASNGLMKAGAWGAAWREMERVDAEIEPYVPAHLVQELESLAASQVVDMSEEYIEDEIHEAENHHSFQAPELSGAEIRKKLEDDRMREIYGQSIPELEIPIESPLPPPAEDQRRAPSRAQSINNSTRRQRSQHDDSLPSLLLAAIKVALQDRKNVAICILSFLVLCLALQSGSTILPAVASVENIMDAVSANPSQIATTVSDTTLEVSSKMLEVGSMVTETAKEVEAAVVDAGSVIVKSTKAIIEPIIEDVTETVEDIPSVQDVVQSAENAPSSTKDLGSEIAGKHSSSEPTEQVEEDTKKEIPEKKHSVEPPVEVGE